MRRSRRKDPAVQRDDGSPVRRIVGVVLLAALAAAALGLGGAGPARMLAELETWLSGWMAGEGEEAPASAVVPPVAVQGQRRELPPPQVAEAINQGLAALRRRNSEEAGAAFDQALAGLAGHEAQLPKEALLLLVDGLSNLAAGEREGERPAEAERHYLQALGLLEGRFGDDHPHVASTLYDLARLELAREGAREAEGYLERALAIWRQRYGRGKSFGEANALEVLAEVRRLQGRLDDGRRLAAEAGAIRSRLRAEGKAESSAEVQPSRPAPQAAIAEPPAWRERMDQGRKLSDQRRYAEAERLLDEALTAARAAGDESPELARLLKQVGLNYLRWGRPELAERYYRELLAFRLRVSGEQHPATPSAHFDLAAALMRQERPAEAEEQYRAAIALLERQGTGEGYSMGINLEGLAKALAAQGRYDDVDGLYRRSMAIWNRTGKSPDNGYARRALLEYATLLSAQGREQEAAERRAEAMAMLERIRARKAGE